MKRRILFMLAAAALILLLISPCAAEQQYAYVSNPDPADRLNLRMQPSSDADTLGKYYTGTRVKLLGESRNGYAFVNISPMDGFMDERYLSDTPVVSAQPWLMVKNSGGTGVNIRRHPSSDSDILAFVPNGERVTVLAVRSDSWLHVLYGDIQGFASASLLSPDLSFHSVYTTEPIPTIPPQPKAVSSPEPTPSPAPASVSNKRIVFSPGSSIAYLRDQPEENASSIGFVLSGTQVELLKEVEDGWSIVLCGDQMGYIHSKFLKAI